MPSTFARCALLFVLISASATTYAAPPTAPAADPLADPQPAPTPTPTLSTTAGMGRLVVTMTAPDSYALWLDGAPHPPARFAGHDLAAGPHHLQIRRGDAVVAERPLAIVAGETSRVDLVIDAPKPGTATATPGPLGELLVRSAGTSDDPGDVYVDDTLVGQTPWRQPMPPGTYRVRVKRADTRSHEQDVTIADGMSTTVFAAPQAPPPPPRRWTQGAHTLSSGTGSVELATGWPYLAALRVTGGVTDWLDVGVSLRASLATTLAIDARVRSMLVNHGVLAFGIEVGGGYALGASDRNAAAFETHVLGSLLAGRSASITVGVGLRTYSDRTGPESEARHKDRDSGVQLPLSLALEVQFSQAWTGFLRIEGNPLNPDRALLADHPTDTHVYGSLGASVAF